MLAAQDESTVRVDSDVVGVLVNESEACWSGWTLWVVRIAHVFMFWCVQGRIKCTRLLYLYMCPDPPRETDRAVYEDGSRRAAHWVKGKSKLNDTLLDLSMDPLQHRRTK